MKRLVGLALGLTTAACSVVGVRNGTEEPRYVVSEMVGPVEIRHYDARVAIETSVPGDEVAARSDGFRRLADYIFGNNRAHVSIEMTAPVAQASEKVAMTAPVGQDRDAAGNWRIRFFAPSTYTVETMPAPNNPLVSVVPVPAETLAVLRFSGDRSAEAIAGKRAELLSALKVTAWRPADEPFAWFYDPPWTIPAFRRNEVAVPVSRARE